MSETEAYADAFQRLDFPGLATHEGYCEINLGPSLGTLRAVSYTNDRVASRRRYLDDSIVQHRVALRLRVPGIKLPAPYNGIGDQLLETMQLNK